MIANQSEVVTTSYVGSPPLRGTQSLVGVMAFVWKHPSLTALELLWRWIAALPLLALLWYSLWPELRNTPLNSTALQSMTFFDPVRSVGILAGELRLYVPVFKHTGKWWIPCAIVLWTLAAGVGRTAVLRRADPSLRGRVPLMMGFSLLRSACFAALLMMWTFCVLHAVHATITGPAQHGAEPNVVLLTALTVGITLAAFLLWSALFWLIDLAPLQAMEPRNPTRMTMHAQLRSKLMETNLVMGIVRVILLVLALTFSASPLPFQTRETQAYINVWWAATAIFYILSSDFFHVVRRVTYLRLLQSIALQTNAPVPHAS